MAKTPSRFPNGLTNVDKTFPMGKFGLPDPTQWQTFFNDFDRYAAADWVITTTEAGAGDATEALTDIAGGALLITNDAADNDADFFQTVGELFTFASNKKLFFSTRFKVSDATQSDVVIGLQIRDTSPLAVSDGVYFQKDDGDANIDFNVTGSSTTTAATAIGTLVSDTFVILSFYYNGVDAVEYFIDNVRIGSSVTTNLPSTELTVSFGIQNGEAVAKTMTLDYIFVSRER